MKYSITISTDDLGEIENLVEWLNTGDASGDNTAPPTVDSQGLPWDARIHLKSKKTNADGTWGRKKGLDAAAYEAIVAELRARGTTTLQPMVSPMPMITQPAQQMMPVQQQMPQVMQQQPMQQMPQVMQQPMQQMPQVMQQQPQQQAGVAIDFNGFIAKLGPLMQSGQVSQQLLNELVAGVGLPNFDALIANQHLLPQIINNLAMRGLWS